MTDTKLTLSQKIGRVQQAIGKMSKDKEGYNYMYFDINQLIEALLPHLKEEGLTVMQPLTHIDDKPAIKTGVTDGEDTIAYVMPLPDVTKPQEMGSAITYYRRYALQSLFLLQAEDNDGVVGSKPKAEAKKQETVDDLRL